MRRTCEWGNCRYPPARKQARTCDVLHLLLLGRRQAVHSLCLYINDVDSKFGFVRRLQVHLLCCAQNVVDEPVKRQARRHIQRKVPCSSANTIFSGKLLLLDVRRCPHHSRRCCSLCPSACAMPGCKHSGLSRPNSMGHGIERHESYWASCLENHNMFERVHILLQGFHTQAQGVARTCRGSRHIIHGIRSVFSIFQIQH